LEQTLNYVAYSAQEVLDRNNQHVLILSSRAKQALINTQLQTLSKAVSRIIDVDMSLIENLGGGSVSGMIGELF